jgi:hypothetical protein
VTRRIAILVASTAIVPSGAEAHRLDEYLHAARVAVAREAIRVEMDLTPGVGVARDVIRIVDRDGDGRITGHEAEGYARAILGRVHLTLDGQSQPLSLQHVEISPGHELLDGMGTISIVAAAQVATSSGRHQVVLRNEDDSPDGVYLVNALIPDTPGIVITSQTRDPRQRELRLEYDVRSTATPAWWVLAACATLGTLGAQRLKAVRRPGAGNPVIQNASPAR